MVLQKDSEGRPVHVVLGTPAGKTAPAVVVTAYRPDPLRWSSDYLTRKTVTRQMTKLIREGQYAPEVSVNVIDEEGGWSPYLSVDEANKLDMIREALRSGDLTAAAKYGRVFELLPVSP